MSFIPMDVAKKLSRKKEGLHFNNINKDVKNIFEEEGGIMLAFINQN